MTNSTDAYSPQRHATRAPVERPVRLLFEKTKQVVEGECHNISIGGMFVSAQAVEAPGAVVRFELALDDGSAIRGLADVMWTSSGRGGPTSTSGFGIKFKYLEQRDRQLIFKLVSRHIKDRLADRHPVAAMEPDPRPAGLVVPPVVARPKGPAVPAPAAGPPSDPGPEPPSEDDGERPSIFAAGSGLDTLSGPETDGDSELPEDWDTDPTAFRMPEEGSEASDASDPPSATIAPGPSEPTPGEPAPVELAQTVGTEASVPAVAASFDSQAGSLSDVFMQSDGFSLDLPLDTGSESEPDLPLVTQMPADAASDPYLQHLGEDHFEHRPAPRRDLPILPVASLVMVLAAALAYFFSDQIFDWIHGQEVPPPVELSRPATEPSDPAPGAQAEQSSESPRESAQPSPPPPTPRTAPPPTPRTAPPASSPRQNNTEGKPFKALADVRWQAQGTGLLLTLKTDGRVDRGRVDHFRLEGESPREVIRLLGMGRKVTRPTLSVGIGGVRQIRFGWHRKRAGDEVHLVLDMADKQSRVLGVRSQGEHILVEVGR